MKKRFICFIILASTLILTSCYNYKDVNRMFFLTAFGIDVDEDDNVVAYGEVFVAGRKAGELQGKEEAVTFMNKGKTIFQAIRNMNLNSRYPISFVMNRAILFSEKAAMKGMDDYLDFLLRDQESLIRQHIFIACCPLEELIKIEMEEDKFVGIFLNLLMQNEKALANTSETTFGEFMLNKSLGSKINVINMIGLHQNPSYQGIDIKGLAVIQDDKMVGKMSLEEGRFYRHFQELKHKGTINVTNPEKPGKHVILESESSKTKGKIYYDGKTIHVIRTVNVRASFAGSEGGINLQENAIREAIEAEVEKIVEEGCMELFRKFKEQGIDVFNLKAAIEKKYPELATEDFLDKVKVKVIANVKIDGSSDITNYY